MSVHTTYDELRDQLRDNLNDCLRLAKGLFDESKWGYEEMKENYDIDVYQAIRTARDII